MERESEGKKIKNKTKNSDANSDKNVQGIRCQLQHE